MDKPKVSIITINLNNVEGLEKTIDSVKNQTYTNIEFIIIDGNSNDGSKRILESEVKSINFWLSEADKGVFNAMNKGISEATGDYLQFLNSGDVFSGNTVLQDFINHSKFKGEIVYGDYKFKNGGKTYPDQLSPQFFMRSSLPHQSTLISKNVFDKIGLYDESFKIIGDRAHFFKVFLSGQFQFTHVPISLTLFDLNGISNSTEFKKLKQEEDERMFKDYFGVFYEDYLELFKVKRQLNATEKKTLSGILKRVQLKISNLWTRP